MSWWTIGFLVVGAYGLKLFGVVVLARVASVESSASGPVGWFPAMVTLIPAALFAALIAVQTLESEGTLRLDARLAGVAVGAVAVWRRVPFAAVVIMAMTVTAAIRWQTLI